MMEVGVGIGYIMGSLLGTLLYMLGGYMLPFLFCSFLYLISIPITIMLLPSDHSINEEEKQDEKPLSIRKYIASIEMSLTILLVTISYMCYGLITPFLPQHLHKYGIKGEQVGFFFGIPSASYMIGAILYNKLPKYVDLKVWIIVGSLINVLSLLVVGPEEYTYLPTNLISVGAGLFIMGIGSAILLVPILPQLIAIANNTFPNENQKVSDMSTGFFSLSIYFSVFASPIIGGFLVKYYGFNRGSTIWAFVAFIVTILYGIISGGFIAFKTLRRTNYDY